MSYTFGPASPGMHPVFAKKKRSVFKGPSLGNTPGARGRGPNLNSSGENSRGTSAQGRPSNEITITEEDEEEEEQQQLQEEQKDFFGKVTLHDQGMRLVEEDEEEEDLEVEEVESFSPIEEGNTTAFIIEEEEEEEDPDADVTVIPNLDEEEEGEGGETKVSSSTEMSRSAKTIAEDVLSRRVVEGEEAGDTSGQGLGISGAAG
jgi:hypothetical protein